DKEVGIDDSAAHQRLAGLKTEPGGVHRPSGDQRSAIVGPWAKRALAARKPDGKRVADLPCGEAEPVFVADLLHLRRPELGDSASLGRPHGFLAQGKDEALGLPMLGII